jgi:hypothetical protein
MAKHPVFVEGFDESLKILAQRVCRMRYDKLYEFLEACAEELNRQACVDARGGRAKLADSLQDAAIKMIDVESAVLTAFTISAPYMQKQFKETPVTLGT